MSVGAELWRQVTSRAEAVPRREISQPAPARMVNSVPDPALSLVHQLFFPTAALRRTSVLLAAADASSKASGLSEQIAIALSNHSGEMVGIVETGNTGEALPLKKAPSNTARTIWQACTLPVAERVRRIPPALLFESIKAEREPDKDGLAHLKGAFSYFLFSAAVFDSELPLLSRMCDAAVLVLTANVTRKQAALRAKELLVRQGITFLGTVLDKRTLPIPESIYRHI
ncbi:MAG TPA: hypothetical protein VJO35_00980 [Terriglobales bacterium]|nr:hypothetical protein [Terriglobales bacterium]